MTNTPPVQPGTPKRPQKMASNQNLNMNHLLNFTLPPRQTRPHASIPRRGRKTGAHQGVWNKERFVNAQYRFVMNPNGDYTVHFADPDIFFQWQDILQVLIPRSSALASVTSNPDDEGNLSCPICLSIPTAPRMTKCGHIFCFPCILHYLNTSDNKWARCPICFDSVNEFQLKSVKWYEGVHHTEEDPSQPSASSSSSNVAEDAFNLNPKAGSMLRMRLIQRPQITTLALPRSSTWPSDLLPPHQAPFHFLPDVYEFSKFMLATPEYLIADLSKDLDELATERRILAGMNDDLGTSFIDSAESKVRGQIAKAGASETAGLKSQIDHAHRDQREIQARAALNANRNVAEPKQTMDPEEVPEEFLALKSGPISKPPTPTPTKPQPVQNRNGPRQRKNVNPPAPVSDYYYYQAASGLPLFLHPLDIRILLSHFTSYSSFPDSINIRVAACSEGSVNDDLRKRCKYLAHLPEGADVVFVEADLEGVVGQEGLKNFESALKLRMNKRKDKERKDDRARARAEEREREKELASARRSQVNNARYSDFSFVPDEPPLTVPGQVEDHGATSEAPPRESSSPPSAPAPTSGAWGTRSFASALHSAASSNPRSTPAQRRDRGADEWDVDAAWHELERNAGTRKKRGAKLVVLGSGGGGARRR